MSIRARPPSWLWGVKSAFSARFRQTDRPGSPGPPLKAGCRIEARNHVRNRRSGRRAQRRPHPDGGAAPARVPRLRFGRHRGAERLEAPHAPAHRRQGAHAGRSARAHPDQRQDRHRAYPLGHARCAERAQCAPAHLARRSRHRAQRHHREPRRAARRPGASRLRVQLRDRYRGHRAPHSLSPADRRGPVQGGARHGRGARGRVRAAGGERTRPRSADPRARGLPGRDRPGRR